MDLRVIIAIAALAVTWPIWMTYYIATMYMSLQSPSVLLRILLGYPMALIFFVAFSWMLSFVCMAIDFVIGIKDFLDKPIKWSISSWWIHHYVGLGVAFFLMLAITNELSVLKSK